MIPLPEIPYDEWFHEPHPHDSMPIATDNPRPEEEIADDYASVDEQEVTMHEKAFKLARSKYNPFAVGGSESIHDFEGGSEKCQKK